ncbi:nuclear transport factor 2 family protein [Filimonas lacunae]|nr:nuclear transport factor 2 family protein [Filimonas lacunae]BAV07328.1 hypothetical protein FLA_3351 [Filimonas lacunae]
MNTQEEVTAITAVLQQYYFKGLYEGDTSLLARAFLPGTQLFGDVNRQPYAKTLDQYLDGVAHRASPKAAGKTFEPEIIAIDVINSIAIAKLHVKMYDFNYYNFLTFHKVNDKWLIVHKTLTHVAES